MQFEILKIKDLKEFVSSKQFLDSKVLPITSHRAISHINNPRASHEDVCLILAKDDKGSIIGYIGMLPDRFNENGQAASWLSCWWVDDNNGKKIALHLFLQAIKLSKGNLIITDFTPEIITIAEKTKLFQFAPSYYGVRGFMGFDLQNILPRKYKFFKRANPISIRSILKITDSVFNFLLKLFLFFLKKNFNNKNIVIEEIKRVDKESSDFISQYNENEYFKKGVKEIDWMIDYPWVIQKDKNNEADRYYFSAIAETFNYYCIKIKEQNSLIGFVVLRQRNNDFTTPYIYCKTGSEMNCLNAIYLFLIKNKARQFTIFHPKFVKFVNERSSPFFYKRDIQKDFAISRSLKENYNELKYLQDGDGDYAFT